MVFFLVPFKSCDAYTASLLKMYACSFQRCVILPELIEFKLSQVDWGECGTIRLKKVGESTCEVVYGSPPAVTGADACYFYGEFKKRQAKAYFNRRLAEAPDLNQEALYFESLDRAEFDLRVDYPDFPDVGRERLRQFLAGETARGVSLGPAGDWDWFTPAIQSYITRQRVGLLEFIKSKHTQGLAEMQGRSGLALIEAGAAKSRSGPRSTDPRAQEQIIAEWEQVRGSMNQEVFCSSKGIGPSTLRAWMRKRKGRRSA